MNIFWILFILISATSVHPLGTAPGFPDEFSRYVRILPLCSLLDVSHMYFHCLQQWRAHGTPIMAAARVICTKRLKKNLRRAVKQSEGDEQEGPHEEPEQENHLRAQLIQLYLELIPRLLANMGVVLAYTKICGFRGVPNSHGIASICFATWAAMEIFSARCLRSSAYQKACIGPRPSAFRQNRTREIRTRGIQDSFPALGSWAAVGVTCCIYRINDSQATTVGNT